MSTNNTDLFSYLPGLELSENEILEAELSAQQILKAKYPDLDLREGTGLRDLVIRPSATLLALVNKALVFYFQNNDISSINNDTPQEFVDRIMSNWFLTRKVGVQAIINARMYFAKSKNVNFYSDLFFSTDGTLKFSPISSVTFASSQLTFDVNSNQYYVDVDLMAEKPGKEYNISAGSLLYFSNFDPYFLHAEINYLKDSAQDIETNTQFIARAKSAISTRNNINVPSIDANLSDYFTTLKEVYTVGFGDAEMTRDQIKVVIPGVTDPVWFHNGGCSDVYCRVPLASSIVQLTTDSTGKVDMTGAVYTFERSELSGGSLDDTLPFNRILPVISLTRSSTTATVEVTDHGHLTGDFVTIAGATQTAYNGLKEVTYIDDNHFTFVVSGSPVTPATGTITSYVPTPYTWFNTNEVLYSITGITRSGSTATVTCDNHGLMVNDRVTVAGAGQSGYNKTAVVLSVPTRDTFTYAVDSGTTTPATGTITATFIDRMNDVGFSDRQSLTIDFGNEYADSTVSFIISYHQNIDSIQAYLEDKNHRVICADLLARGFNLTLLDVVITAYNGPAPDAELCNTVVLDYLAGLGHGEPFIMSDLLAKLYAAGITTIKTPITVTYVKYWNDMMGTTTGTIIDAEDPKDSTNIYMLNTLSTENEVIA